MIRAQVCSVENANIMGRNATPLPYMMGKKVEVHPLTACYCMIYHSPRGGSHKVLGSSQVQIGADLLLNYKYHHLGLIILKSFKTLLELRNLKAGYCL